MPFLCLYFSGGICDENGMHLIATRKTCTEISNGACQIEFERARSNGLNVPDCSGLPEEQINCSAITSGMLFYYSWRDIQEVAILVCMLYAIDLVISKAL